MAEHRIQLRRAWDLRDATGTRRIDLPTSWPLDLPGPIHLSRRFQAPPLDPDRDRLALRWENVPGLIGARLNGFEIAGPKFAEEVPLDVALPARNLLILELDPAGFGLGSWGSICLVIRSD